MTPPSKSFTILFKYGRGWRPMGTIEAIDALHAAKIAYKDFQPHRDNIGVKPAGSMDPHHVYNVPPRGRGGMILRDGRVMPLSELSEHKEPTDGNERRETSDGPAPA